MVDRTLWVTLSDDDKLDGGLLASIRWQTEKGSSTRGVGLSTQEKDYSSKVDIRVVGALLRARSR